MPCPARSILTLPGLMASTSSRQAARKAASAFGSGESVASGIAGLQGRRDVRRELAVEQIIDECGGNIELSDRLQSTPRCNAVDFEHQRTRVCAIRNQI